MDRFKHQLDEWLLCMLDKAPTPGYIPSTVNSLPELVRIHNIGSYSETLHSLTTTIFKGHRNDKLGF
ncbi:hypothetical protein E2C01_093403 [Portunus trituberculatus]|uniref:Uncharacterized protein n=1 Tax=Portunus trituberculatus TaxID=210409 RepID=A0A5B7JUC1_PORTR|nr:hypothetical protein [Portunus trituberculatus]